jgi:hypothetical protein
MKLRVEVVAYQPWKLSPGGRPIKISKPSEVFTEAMP